MSLGQKARAGMVWQSSAGGFCTEAAHFPQGLACSALSNTSGILQSKEIDAKLRMAPLDAQGEPRKSNQPQNTIMRMFFLGWEWKLGEALWDGAARTSRIHHQLPFPWEKGQLLIYLFVSAP